MYTAENASDENIFFLRKKKEFFSDIVWYGLSAFKLYPFNMKTRALQLYFFSRKYYINEFPMALLSFPNLT